MRRVKTYPSFELIVKLIMEMQVGLFPTKIIQRQYTTKNLVMQAFIPLKIL